MLSLDAKKIDARRYGSSCEASGINRCDCIHLFADILIRPGSTSGSEDEFQPSCYQISSIDRSTTQMEEEFNIYWFPGSAYHRNAGPWFVSHICAPIFFFASWELQPLPGQWGGTPFPTLRFTRWEGRAVRGKQMRRKHQVLMRNSTTTRLNYLRVQTVLACKKRVILPPYRHWLKWLINVRKGFGGCPSPN